MTIRTLETAARYCSAREGSRIFQIELSPTTVSVYVRDDATRQGFVRHLSFEDFYNALSKLESTPPMMEVPV